MCGLPPRKAPATSPRRSRQARPCVATPTPPLPVRGKSSGFRKRPQKSLPFREHRRHPSTRAVAGSIWMLAYRHCVDLSFSDLGRPLTTPSCSAEAMAQLVNSLSALYIPKRVSSGASDRALVPEPIRRTRKDGVRAQVAQSWSTSQRDRMQGPEIARRRQRRFRSAVMTQPGIL